MMAVLLHMHYLSCCLSFLCADRGIQCGAYANGFKGTTSEWLEEEGVGSLAIDTSTLMHATHGNKQCIVYTNVTIKIVLNLNSKS